jgi:hypothetical protein
MGDLFILLIFEGLNEIGFFLDVLGVLTMEFEILFLRKFSFSFSYFFLYWHNCIKKKKSVPKNKSWMNYKKAEKIAHILLKYRI